MTLLTLSANAADAGIVRVRDHERAVGVGADTARRIEQGDLAVPVPEARTALPTRKELQTPCGAQPAA